MKLQILLKDLRNGEYLFITANITQPDYMNAIDKFFKMETHNVVFMMIEKSVKEHLWFDVNTGNKFNWKDKLVNLEKPFIFSRPEYVYNCLPIMFHIHKEPGIVVNPIMEEHFSEKVNEYKETFGVKFPITDKIGFYNFLKKIFEEFEITAEVLDSVHYQTHREDIDLDELWNTERIESQGYPDEFLEFLLNEVDKAIDFHKIDRMKLYDFFSPFVPETKEIPYVDEDAWRDEYRNAGEDLYDFSSLRK